MDLLDMEGIKMTQQFALNIGELLKKDISEYEKFYNIVSQDRKNKVDRLVRNQDKITSLFSYVLLLYALKKIYGIENPVIEKGEKGKPYLKDYDDIHFNISHSGEWVVCAVGPNKVGIDVEQISDRDLKFLKRVYHQKENDIIWTKEEKEARELAFKIWTLKESYVKCIGIGLTKGLKTFYFDAVEEDNIKIFIEDKMEDKYIFKVNKLDEGYMVSVCIENNEDINMPLKLDEITIKELLKLNLQN